MSSTATRPSPAKPWERNGGAPAPTTASSLPAPSPATTTGATTGPALPPKPTDMTSSTTSLSASTNTALSTTNNTASAYGSSPYNPRYGSSYGAGSYGSSYGSAYSSPYSRFGAGGYGGFGGGYGGYGGYGASPYGGMGAFGGNGFGAGMPGQPSLTQQMESGTAATFQLLQSVVSAFGGFAQMLESTFMATHSSFFAMIGVAEQFASLRNWLGEVLSVFTLLRWVKRILGYENQAGAAGEAISADSFRAFEANGGKATPGKGGPKTPKHSKKPIIIFFLTIVGLPWLMNKLVRLITAKQEAEARRLGLPPGAMVPIMDQQTGQPLPQHLQPPGVDLSLLPSNQAQIANTKRLQEEASLDPSQLTFVRATHAYAPSSGEGQAPAEGSENFELTFEKNEIIAVLTPKENRQDPGWWRGRLRSGKIGWFPSTHVQEVPMNGGKKA